MIIDITDQKRAEALVLAANRQMAVQARILEVINAELNQFTAIISHDLRAPLRMVTSYLALIVKKLGSDIDDEMKEFIEFAHNGAKRMDSMITGLLDYSRAGHSNAAFDRIALSDIVNECVLDLSWLIKDSGAVVDVADGLPTVFGEPVELLRLFQNLIGNAVKFRLPDRPVRVSVGWRDDDVDWVVWVRDNGIGIDPSNCERLFGIFQRLVSQKDYEGSGIGLAVCKKIVEHHGGRIWVESALGEGSTFLVSFPKDAEK